MKFLILFSSVSAVSVVQSYYTLIFRFSVFMQLTATLLLFWVTFTPKPRDTVVFVLNTGCQQGQPCKMNNSGPRQRKCYHAYQSFHFCDSGKYL